ncbi:MAG TPA: T9SS type A sorting domain-containing protein, partial [Chitinophagaceae bacterium]|nr:T9SS type A sorting domain-containing protein [Chitinophagaceae bacterium]
TYSSTFIVGLEFNTLTGDGYQLEFSTGSAPYSIYLRKVTSFGPPLVAGAPQQIFLPSGKNIYQQNGDIVITPTGKMYFVLDNKMFALDYSTYGTGVLNATYIDTLKNGTGNNVIGLSYAGGNFIVSVQGSTCSYKQIDISSGVAVVQNVTLAAGNFVSYDMATLVTGIGAAKKLTSLSKTGALTYVATYDIKVKNYGNVNLNSVQLVDSVKTAFGSSFVSASLAAVGSLPSGVTLNALFNGNTIATIFATGSTMKASPSDSATVRVTVNLLAPNILTTYYNSAIATATGSIFSNAVRDSSDNQASLNPDVSGTDVPDLTGEDVPTPITPAVWLLLPNKIVYFNAKHNGSVIDVRWNLEDEIAGSSIVLQRSTDGIHFEVLTKIPQQNPNDNNDYSWRDAYPQTGNNFYRLQLKSPSGDNVYSDIVVVNNIDKAFVLSANPNPFIQTVNFSVTLDKADKIIYTIFDFNSQVIKTGQTAGHEGSNTVTVNNLDRIPAGNYVLEIMVGNDRYFKKIVKN